MKKLGKVKVIIASALVSLISLVFYPSASYAGTVISQGTTTSYAVLAGSAITNTGSTTITGTAGSDIGVSTGTSIGGFPPGSAGAQHSNDASAIAAQSALVTAISDVIAPTATVIPADLNSQVLDSGSYTPTGSAFSNSGTVTFDAQGDPNAIFVMQAPSSTITTATSSTMLLAHGAQACNIFWAIGSSATLGADSLFVGHLYAVASISLLAGATE